MFKYLQFRKYEIIQRENIFCISIRCFTNCYLLIWFLQNLRPDIPRCCPSSFASIMKKCWDANPQKRPEMEEVVRLLEAIDTSKGGGMIPEDQASGCFCFAPMRGPWNGPYAVHPLSVQCIQRKCAFSFFNGFSKMLVPRRFPNVFFPNIFWMLLATT